MILIFFHTFPKGVDQIDECEVNENLKINTELVHCKLSLLSMRQKPISCSSVVVEERMCLKGD